MGCDSSDTRTLVRFIDNCLKITKGNDIQLCSDELCLKDFFQSVSTFNYEQIKLSAGSTASINKEMNFIFIQASWPSTAVESSKKLELQVSDFDYTIGGTGPLGATGLNSEKIPFKELYMINAVENHEHLYFTNPSIHPVTINLFTAKD